MVTIAPPVVSAPGASIAQRLDRLPLTWTLWRLGLVAQAGWALVIASDGIAARIYPFVWGPAHAFDTESFSLLLVVSTGLGPLGQGKVHDQVNFQAAMSCLAMKSSRA